MAPVTIQQGLQVKQIAEDRFRNTQIPWTWPQWPVVPGGILIAWAANAAYETVAQGFVLDNVTAHFLSAPRNTIPIDLEVQRIKDGGRFAHRVILVKQNGANMVHLTASFIRASAMTGPSMQHHPERNTQSTVEAITLDDLAPERTDLGPWMKSQRLSVTYTGAQPRPGDTRPESQTYTSVAQIVSPIAGDDARTHILGLLTISDYHVLDCPPTLHHRHVGSAQIGDVSQKQTKSEFKIMTSLNHSIQLRLHEGFRVDELIYIEATSAWAGERRAEISTQMFDAKGRLLATCKQEGYYVLNDNAKL